MNQQRIQTILVIDDIYPLFKLMRHTLENGRFRAFHAKSPDEGLTIFRDHRGRIDLVMIDMVKPAARNLDLAAELERLSPGLPILYVLSEDRTIARCSIEAQAPEAVLVTPFTQEQFMDRVARLLDVEVTLCQRPEEQLWDRLMADSNRISSGGAMLCLYEWRQVSVAAGHVAMLRPSNIECSLQPTNNDAVPYSMVVRAPDFSRARRLISHATEGVAVSAA
jgi:DNA-binding NtrC family response regulator